MNYKETIKLPRTSFSMKGGLIKREPELLDRWSEMDIEGRITAARKDSESFVLHDGPPYANGHVHLGTALNKILKDFIVKSHTMMGYYSPYVPGWDCHGMPIEHKVMTEPRCLLWKYAADAGIMLPGSLMCSVKSSNGSVCSAGGTTPISQ